MGQTIELAAADGHAFAAYEAGPTGASRALVVVQEISGVNAHIRAVADRFAAIGFHVIAPALFDRAERGVELGYDEAGMKKGLALRAAIAPADTRADLEAAAAAFGHDQRIGIIGYCWGGSLAWVGATETNRFKAAIGWYGAAIVKTAEATPHCPVQLHFGADDQSIPHADIEKIRAAQPGIEIFVYDGAGHGFGCDVRASYNPDAYALAQSRSVAFLERHL